MPKINFGVADAADVAAADGYPVYKGELPPNGAYEAILKVVKVGKIGSGNDKGKNRLQIVAILDDPDHPEFNGCPVFDNKNLTEQGVPYVNQFLEALTDGSDAAKKAILKAFWKTGPIVDDAKEHILKIGRTQVNSPKGTIRVTVGTKLNTWQGNTSVKAQQWMLADGNSGPTEEAPEIVEEEDDSVVEVNEDEDYEDDGEEDPYADSDE